MAKNHLKVRKGLSLTPRSAPTNPEEGDVYFDENAGLFQFYEKGKWFSLDKTSGVNNFFSNGNFESNTDLVTLFNDGASYIDGTGGTVAALSKSQNTTTPLAGSADLKITKAASDASGEGFTFTSTTIDKRYKTKKLWFKGYADLSDANYTSGDIKMHAYDVTNGAIIPFRAVAGILEDNTLANYETDLLGYVIVPDGCEEIRISGHIASDSTTGTGWDAYFDDMKLTPDASALGLIGTDWESFTPTGSWTTNTTYTGKKKRIGDTMHVSIQVALSGAPNATNLTIDIPDGESIDTTKVNVGSVQQDDLGKTRVLDSGSAFKRKGSVSYNSSTSVLAWTVSGTQTDEVIMTNTDPVTFANGDRVWINFSVPIEGWKASFAMSATEVNLSRASVSAYLSSDQAVSNGNDDTIVFDTLTPGFTDKFSLLNTGTGEFTVKKSGKYYIRAKTRISDADFDAAESVNLRIKVNGTTVSEAQTEAEATLSSPVQSYFVDAFEKLSKDDVVTVSLVNANVGADITVDGGRTLTNVSIIEQPDETFFGAYNEPEIISASSSSFPLTTSGYSSLEWAQMTGNSVELTPGLWRVVPEAEYVASGSSDLFRIDVVLSKDNGDNTSAFPAAPDSTIQHGKTHTFISVPSASTLGTTSLIGRPAYILVTETETIYAVPRFGFTTAGSANGYVRISAERIW